MNRKIKLTVLLVVLIMVMGVFVQLGLAKKGDNGKPLEWSNGFPSGEHFNLNIQGKKDNHMCNNSPEAEPFGNVIFVPLHGPSEINFVVNHKKSPQVSELTVLDPCAAPFGKENKPDPALIQLPPKHYQVYVKIGGKPTVHDPPGPPAVIFYPRLRAACDETTNETVYRDVDGGENVTKGDIRLANAGKFGFTDGTFVKANDPDVGLKLVPFNDSEKHTNLDGNGIFNISETIYYDDDNNGNVSYGDIRIANAATVGFADGSIVNATGDLDIGNPLAGFKQNEMHEDTSVTAGFLDWGLTGFGDLTSCQGQATIGIGAISGTDVFGINDTGLYRFDEPDPSTPSKGKGKSTAVDITGMFQWTGWACDPAIDINNDGVINASDVPPEFNLPPEEVNETELINYLVSLDGQNPGCAYFDNGWIFDIADLVVYGWDYENRGARHVQVRFYPVDTTDFET